MGIRTILIQAANTAELTGSKDEDSVWEYAHHTLCLEDEEHGSPSTPVEDLEAVFDRLVRQARVEGVPIPEYILKEFADER